MTLHDVRSHTVHEALLADHGTDGLRSGEGSVVALDDGSLYTVYGSFEGPSDEAYATLVARRSEDGGRLWSDPVAFCSTPKDALNVMSASLLRMSDGRIGALYLLKRSTRDCRPVFTTSSDGARTWSEPAAMVDGAGYYVVHNDRLVQLTNDRLLAPFSLAAAPARGACGCLFSDDLGQRWRIGATVTIEKRNILEPRWLDQGNPRANAFWDSEGCALEPGVVELRNGRVLMWCRSPGGYAYRAVSGDGGETWSAFHPIAEFAMPNGPQSIKRVPGADRLIMLFNDRSGVPYGSQQFHWRRPLAVAVSDDDAATWRAHGLLEPDTIPSNCYYSICFHGENAVFTYYEGVMHTRADGFFVPRNLASLKLKVVHRSYFLL